MKHLTAPSPLLLTVLLTVLLTAALAAAATSASTARALVPPPPPGAFAARATVVASAAQTTRVPAAATAPARTPAVAPAPASRVPVATNAPAAQAARAPAQDPTFVTVIPPETPRYDGQYLSINGGFAHSKSILGISYTRYRDEVNLGVKGLWLKNGNQAVIVEPGLTYNRYLSENGFYATLTYAPVYLKPAFSGQTVRGHSGLGTPRIQTYSEGWNPGEIFMGFGKSFQGDHWGLHVEEEIVKPATGDFLMSWAYWMGVDVSYRFNRLD